MRVAALVILGLLGFVCVASRSAPVHGASPWTTTGSMNVGRSDGAAVRLLDEQVLVVGGQTQTRPVTVTANAEGYNPTTGTWTAVQSMSVPRAGSTATLLLDGRVLVAGGTDGRGCLSSAELFDPRTNRWSSAGTMTTPRCHHTATLLEDGRVLVVGGFAGNAPLDSAELYNPASNSWTGTDPMRWARGNHSATRLSDGRVLVAGGFGASGPLNSVEVYDPNMAEWVGFLPLPGMWTARYHHTATLLPDGRVLVTGGFGSAGPLASAELYDPRTGFWAPARSMATLRARHTATLLPNGQVLVTGGEGPPGQDALYTRSAELYNPATDIWSPAGVMAEARYGHVAMLLDSGQVLVAGGSDGPDTLSTAEIYGPEQASAPSKTTNLPTRTPTPTPTVLSARAAPTSSAVPTPTPRSTPPLPAPASGPAFRVQAVRIERYGSAPDWRLALASLRRVTVGAPIRLSVYVSFTTRFQASRVVVATDVYYHGKIVYRAGSSEDRSGAGRLWDHWSFTPRQPGTYVLVARVRAGTHREVASATFGAVTKTRGLTFTFVRLETQDEKGHPSTIFARTERVFLVATITMRNAPRPVRVEVGQTLQYLTTSRRDATQRVPAGYWRQLGQRVESWFVTGNGTHPYTISFVPQTPYSALRMVVDVTISSRTQRRAAVFEVHG